MGAPVTAELPGIAEHLAAEKESRLQRWEREQDEENLRSMRACWPEWDGPKVGMRCEVRSTVVHDLTDNDLAYHYCAPVVLEEHDGEYWIARVDYDKDCWAAKVYNGRKLRLRMSDIWPPVHDLSIGGPEEVGQ